MEQPREPTTAGRFETRYLAFLETVVHLRARLHRYCARMTGSVLDGEDVMQEALFEAYRKLDQFDETRSLEPWLFRIAHNRCIDWLRRRGAMNETDAEVEQEHPATDAPPALGLGRAVECLVIHLPPKERACVLLKDVFDDSLVEIAEFVDSTVGGVKAALHRGRAKLAGMHGVEERRRTISPGDAALLRLYVERFNQRDWVGLRALIGADARLQVADRFVGQVADSPYFAAYERTEIPWRMALGEVDGEPAVLILRDFGTGLVPAGVSRVECVDGRIARITDYVMCPWVLPAAGAVLLDGAPCAVSHGG